MLPEGLTSTRVFFGESKQEHSQRKTGASLAYVCIFIGCSVYATTDAFNCLSSNNVGLNGGMKMCCVADKIN